MILHSHFLHTFFVLKLIQFQYILKLFASLLKCTLNQKFSIILQPCPVPLLLHSFTEMSPSLPSRWSLINLDGFTHSWIFGSTLSAPLILTSASVRCESSQQLWVFVFLDLLYRCDESQELRVFSRSCSWIHLRMIVLYVMLWDNWTLFIQALICSTILHSYILNHQLTAVWNKIQ